MNKLLASVLPIVSICLLSSCASQPQLRPILGMNGKLRQMGNAEGERIVDDCIAKAREGKVSSTTYGLKGKNKDTGDVDFQNDVNFCLRKEGLNPQGWKLSK